MNLLVYKFFMKPAYSIIYLPRESILNLPLNNFCFPDGQELHYLSFGAFKIAFLLLLTEVLGNDTEHLLCSRHCIGS